MQDEQAQEPEAISLLPDHDLLLEALVRVANRDVETSVTLMLRGVTIAGTLVGGRQYFDGIAGQIRGATSNMPEVTAELARTLEEAAAEIYGFSEREGPGEGDGASPDE